MIKKQMERSVKEMERFKAIVAKHKGILSINDLRGYQLIGKGADGSVFQLTSDRCVKIFESQKTKQLELKALKAGQTSPIIPRLYEDGPNYIVLEYIDGISLPKYLKKEKHVPKHIAVKVLYMLDEMKKIGFTRCDTEVRHILFNEQMDIKVIDLKRAYNSIRPNPSKLLKGFKAKGYLEEFMQHVNQLDPVIYEEWKSLMDKDK